MTTIEVVRALPEARLRREILLAFGRAADVLIHPNPVGHGYTQALARDLPQVLAPFGQAAVSCAMAALHRRRIEYGLGTGSPDMVGCAAGHAFGLELKAPGKSAAPEQRQWHDAAARKGFPVTVVRTVAEAGAAIAAARRAP